MQYISFYDHEINKNENRAFSPAGRDITEYVACALTESQINVQIISPVCTKNTKGFFSKKKYTTPEGFEVILPFTFGANSIFTKILKRIWQVLLMYIFIIPKIKKNTTLIIYHSVSLTKILWLLKKIKHTKIILQVEEIYADVTENDKYRKKEKRAFEIADGFIFPTESLAQIVNKKRKPYVILHGQYSIKKHTKSNEEKYINCVYAGTFDENKGGVFKAIEAAKYLNEKYILHILGFGTEYEIKKVRQKIDEIQCATKCKIVYGGLIKGEAFLRYIQKCRIGLSTQNTDGKYNETSFPSKVLMYMSNGLDVVSVDLDVLRKSEVTNYIEYAEESNGYGIAKAIERVALNKKTDNKKILADLDLKFKKNFNKMLGEFENEI